MKTLRHAGLVAKLSVAESDVYFARCQKAVLVNFFARLEIFTLLCFRRAPDQVYYTRLPLLLKIFRRGFIIKLVTALFYLQVFNGLGLYVTGDVIYLCHCQTSRPRPSACVKAY